MQKQHPIIVLFLITVSSLIQTYGSPDDERLQCLVKYKVRPEDMQHMGNFENFTEDMFCAVKCTMEVDKIINPDGSINAENIENCERLNKLPDDQKAKLKECLNSIDKIETCKDMLKTSKCGEGLDL